jgi:hypothetical protein
MPGDLPMTKTWLAAYWTVAMVAVFRMIGHPEPRAVEPACAIRRTEYHLAILGFEWSKKVRETPMLMVTCPTPPADGGR